MSDSDNMDLEIWIDLGINEIVKIMEKRREDGEQRRQRFREKMENLKERYERIMERRIERMRKDGINITLEEFRNRIDPEILKKTGTLEEEEYRRLFGNTSADHLNISRNSGDLVNDNQVHSDESETDSDREVVDCEIYGIANPVKPEIKMPNISILRPMLKEPPVEETEKSEQTEQTELNTITEGTQSSVKTIRLKHVQRKHIKSKPKPKRANSQANLKKFENNSVDDTAIDKGKSAFLDSFLRQNSSLAPSETREKLRKASAKLRAIKAISGNFHSDATVDTQTSDESKKKPPARTISTDSFSIPKRGLKKRLSRPVVHNESLRNLRSK